MTNPAEHNWSFIKTHLKYLSLFYLYPSWLFLPVSSSSVPSLSRASLSLQPRQILRTAASPPLFLKSRDFEGKQTKEVGSVRRRAGGEGREWSEGRQSESRSAVAAGTACAWAVQNRFRRARHVEERQSKVFIGAERLRGHHSPCVCELQCMRDSCEGEERGRDGLKERTVGGSKHTGRRRWFSCTRFFSFKIFLLSPPKRSLWPPPPQNARLYSDSGLLYCPSTRGFLLVTHPLCWSQLCL